MDRLQMLAHDGKLLRDAAQLGTVIDGSPLPLQLVEGRLDTLADRRHFPAEIGGQVLDRIAQGLERGRRIAGIILVVERFWLHVLGMVIAIIVRHAVSSFYRSSPMLWLRPWVSCRSISWLMV